MWGNVWEWTSTARTSSSAANTQAVKGGAWSSARTDCRTENRAESRNPNQGYDTSGSGWLRKNRIVVLNKKYTRGTGYIFVCREKHRQGLGIFRFWQQVTAAV